MDVNLVLFKKSGSKKSFSLSGDITVIGRRHDCDFYIPLKQVSRRHCQLILNNGTVTIRDMGSKHGTYVNGDAVEEKDLVAGDYIHIPPVTMLVQIDGQPSRIAPPTPAEERPRAKKAAPKQQPEQEKTPPQPDPEDDSFPDLDAEASDSFLDDLKDL